MKTDHTTTTTTTTTTTAPTNHTNTKKSYLTVVKQQIHHEDINDEYFGVSTARTVKRICHRIEHVGKYVYKQYRLAYKQLCIRI